MAGEAVQHVYRAEHEQQTVAGETRWRRLRCDRREPVDPIAVGRGSCAATTDHVCALAAAVEEAGLKELGGTRRVRTDAACFDGLLPRRGELLMNARCAEPSARSRHVPRARSTRFSSRFVVGCRRARRR